MTLCGDWCIGPQYPSMDAHIAGSLYCQLGGWVMGREGNPQGTAHGNSSLVVARMNCHVNK